MIWFYYVLVCIWNLNKSYSMLHCLFVLIFGGLMFMISNYSNSSDNKKNPISYNTYVYERLFKVFRPTNTYSILSDLFIPWITLTFQNYFTELRF